MPLARLLALSGLICLALAPLPGGVRAQDGTAAPAAELPPDGAGTEGEAGRRLPRFASLGSSEINVRTGPGSQYPITWKYVRSGLPVEIVAEFEYWRKIRDHDGSVGWVHKSLLSGKRFASVEGAIRVLYADAADDSRPVLRLEPGVLVRLERCKGAWCRATVEGKRGWLMRDWLWGVYPDEVLD
ncbi:SH3 domain-containing protein [Zavarzinia compransoris]|uniref:SH3b domain-containing protein n=1 Tax=Zavarzinia compransoris TaxID=1264899 RepID=A0A317E4G5_9PROT|nr:SH3 domain-containing protein [Zavarzinia compransoris]PWR21937.1 hypothetical protein DKG75_08125 [Zavarzinia compransoris]TDP47327.1 SH3-like domain-containing protein [Zavarzinia compransoris]